MARLTLWVKCAAQCVEQWTLLDENFASGELRLKWYGWNVERRFEAVRERVREDRNSVGRKLIDIAGYSFRVPVTSSDAAADEGWRAFAASGDTAGPKKAYEIFSGLWKSAAPASRTSWRRKKEYSTLCYRRAISI